MYYLGGMYQMFCEDLESAWPVFEDCLTELAVPKHFTLVDYLTLERTEGESDVSAKLLKSNGEPST
jgi:hypothetical protein